MSKGGQDDQLDKEAAAMAAQRRKKIEPLRQFEKNNSLVSTWVGFTEEIAVFVPISYFEETQMTLGDFNLPAPSSPNMKTALALFLRIASEPNSGTQRGSFSDGAQANYYYNDIVAAMANGGEVKNRPKVRVVVQWMVKNTTLAEPFVRSNIAGVLFVARALDPCYTFGDAVSNVITVNRIINVSQAQRSAKARHTAMVELYKRIGEAVHQCVDYPFSVSEILTMASYPDVFVEHMTGVAVQAVTEAEKKTRDDNVLLASRPPSAKAAAAAVGTGGGGGADAAEQAFMKADVRSKKQIAKDPPPEKKLFNLLSMGNENCNVQALSLRLESMASTNPFVLRMCGDFLSAGNRSMHDAAGAASMLSLLHDEEARNAMKKLDPAAIETSITKHVELLDLFVTAFRPSLCLHGQLATFSKLAEENDSNGVHSVVSFGHPEHGICNILTLKAALERAETFGTDKLLCNSLDYYRSDFFEYTPKQTAEIFRTKSRVHIGIFKERQFVFCNREPGVIPDVPGFDDNTTAPWRGTFPLSGKFCVQLESQYVCLSALELYQVPWTSTTFESDLAAACKEALRPSADAKRLIVALEASSYARRDALQQSYSDSSSSSSTPRVNIVEQQHTEDNLRTVIDQDNDYARQSSNQIRESTTMSYKSALTPSSLTSSDNPYSVMLNSTVFKPNLEHLQESLDRIASMMRVLHEIDFTSYTKFLPKYRHYCAMEYERMMRSCAFNNGTAMNSMYAYNKIYPQHYFGCRMVGTNLSIFGNSVAHTIRALFHEAGVIQETHTLLRFLMIRGNAFDVSSPSIHSIQFGDHSCSKSHNANLVTFLSVPGLVVEESIRSRMAGTDASAESYRIVITDEAAEIINKGAPSNPAEVVAYNIMRMMLSENRISSNRSLAGKASILVEVHQRMMMITNTNLLKHNHEDPSLQMRFTVARYLTPFVSANVGGSLFVRQFTQPTSGKSLSVCKDMMRKLMRNHNVFAAMYFGAVTTNAVSEPNLVLMAAVMPTIMDMIGGLIPRIERYVRYAAQARATARQFAVWRAWYIMTCTPLGLEKPPPTEGTAASVDDSTRNITDSTPLNTLYLQKCAPHAICTLEMTTYVALILMNEMWSWHIYLVMFAVACAMGKWRRKSMKPLFTFGNVPGHQTVSNAADALRAFQFCNKKITVPASDDSGGTTELSVPVLRTIGMTPEDFGRQNIAEMPKFWIDEEAAEDRIGLCTNPYFDSSSAEHIKFDHAGPNIDPNYLCIGFSSTPILQKGIYTILHSVVGFPPKFIKEALDILSSQQNVTLTLPRLRSNVAPDSRLEWDLQPNGTVRYECAPVWRMEKQHLYINTVFLYLSAPRFMRMHVIRSMEVDTTVDGQSWVLPFTTRDDVSITDTVRLKRRPNVHLTVRNPVFISHSSLYSARALSSNWMGVMMFSSYEATTKEAGHSRQETALSVAQKEHIFNNEITNTVKRTDAVMKEHLRVLASQHKDAGFVRLLSCRPTKEYVSLDVVSPDDEAFWYAEFPNIVAGLVNPNTSPSKTEQRLVGVLRDLQDNIDNMKELGENTSISKILSGNFPNGFGQRDQSDIHLDDDDNDDASVDERNAFIVVPPPKLMAPDGNASDDDYDDDDDGGVENTNGHAPASKNGAAILGNISYFDAASAVDTDFAPGTTLSDDRQAKRKQDKMATLSEDIVLLPRKLVVPSSRVSKIAVLDKLIDKQMRALDYPPDEFEYDD